MPTSIDPQPADNEFECANCGAYFYYELTRCPNCGVNVYEPEESYEDKRIHPRQAGLAGKLKDFFHRILNKPYPVDELFGDALDQAHLYNNLLQKVGGDRAAVERLIDFEKKQMPNAARNIWLKNAIQRWQNDNH